MLITLTGENSFALDRALHDLTRSFVVKHGDLALERLDAQEADFAKIREALTSLPLLAARKMVVLRAPGTNKQFSEEIEKITVDLPEITDVILVEPKLDKRLAYYKFLRKNTDFREFPELDAAGLVRWLAAEAKNHDATLSAADARYLVERVGANQQLLANELEKLLLYNAKVTRETIDLLTEAAPQSTIFQLLEAAFTGQTMRMLQLYREQRTLKVEPAQIIATLAWQLHVVALLKTAGNRSTEQIAQEAKLNPFVVRKSQGIARQLSLTRLKRMISDLVDIDSKLKTMPIDADEALQNYLIKFSASSE